MVEKWQYFLVIPASAVAAANVVGASLGNPSDVRQTFVKWPADGGSIDNPIAAAAQYWIASFVAFDDASEGKPSREELEGSLNQHPALATILWVRTPNPHHPDTPENEKHIVVASNWPAFSPGSTCDWPAVTAALTP